MERPLCKLCQHRHYSSEPHVWASRDFKIAVPIEGGVEKPPPKKASRSSAAPVMDMPPRVQSGGASEKSKGEMKSRARTPEKAEAWRLYMRDLMRKRRALKE